MSNITNIESFDALKTYINDLSDFAQTSMKQKVNELNGIVDKISENWGGSNSEKYKRNIEEINQAIDDFRQNCLARISDNISRQVESYKEYENN